jgi:hypothetical protein
MKAFFLATLMLLFKKMALLPSLLTFFSTAQQQSSLKLRCTRPDHLPCQPTKAAELLLDGCKIEPYTIIIMNGPCKRHFSPFAKEKNRAAWVESD